MEILGTGDVLLGRVARVDDRLAGAVRAQARAEDISVKSSSGYRSEKNRRYLQAN